MKKREQNDSVITIDCDYLYPEFACSYLMIEGEKAAFIENNTQYAVPKLISTLKENGLKRDDVEYIIITHVHLDHSGGTSALTKECPNAAVLVHERAARHIVDPERLIKGAKAVHGKEKFHKLYGNIEPINEDRVRVVEDGEKIKFGDRELQFIYTLGHAKHHMCIYDSATNGIFTGDSFGLAYPVMKTRDSRFIFPSTTPADFDPEEARKSINKILNTGAETVFLTHFGAYKDIKEGAEYLIDYINKIEIILNNAIDLKLEGEELDKFCLNAMINFFNEAIEKRGIKLTPALKNFIKKDIVLNAQGIAVVANKKITEV